MVVCFRFVHVSCKAELGFENALEQAVFLETQAELLETVAEGDLPSDDDEPGVNLAGILAIGTY